MLEADLRWTLHLSIQTRNHAHTERGLLGHIRVKHFRHKAELGTQTTITVSYLLSRKWAQKY